MPAETNSLGIEMVRIEPGRFEMGSSDGDWDERPVREVTLSSPFWMAACEVTNAQYERFDPEHRALRASQQFWNRSRDFREFSFGQDGPQDPSWWLIFTCPADCRFVCRR